MPGTLGSGLEGLGNVLVAGEPAGSSGGGGILLDWRQQLIAFAQLNVHSAINSLAFEQEFTNSNSGAFNNTAALAACNVEPLALGGSGAATKSQTAHDGQVQVASGATAGSEANIQNLGGVANAPLIDNPRARVWMLACYAQLLTTPDANTNLFIPSIVGATIDKFIGVRGSVSTTKLVFGIDTINVVATSQNIPGTANFHWYLMGWNTTTLKAFFDLAAAPIGSFNPGPTDIDTTPQQFRARASNGATAANQAFMIDKLAILTNSP